MTEPLWVPRSAILSIHEEQTAEHGGLEGVRDAGLLESALLRAPNAWGYGEIELSTLASLYAEGIAKNHPFVDGNKRTAFLAAYSFLALNDLFLEAPEQEAVVMTFGLASGELPREGFANWLRDRVIKVGD